MIGLGEALLVARKAQGLTQDDVCGQLGITQAALSRYENDQRVPEEVSLQSTNIVPTFDPEETEPVAAALLTRAQWKMPIGPVWHLIRWLEAGGCVIIEEDFGTTRVDGLSQWIGDHPVILINSGLCADRKRLTLAHELGHLCLHSSTATADMEEEANAFAAEFLMPEHVIRPELRNLGLGKLIDLKREWGVSMQAILERAHRLGLVKAHDRMDFCRSLNSRGWKVCEPVSDELPIEHPELTQQIGARMRERGLSDVEIANMAGFAPDAKANPFLV
jgi:Zn-dependent peptidase ImmA (M78 family)/DNA-binding XRE family transcriptional regulator